MNGYWWGGGRTEEGKKYPETVETGGTGGIDLKVVKVSNGA